MNNIHPTAIIGTWCSIGMGNYIGPYVVIGDCVTIGNNNHIGAHTSIGLPPESRSGGFHHGPGNHAGSVIIGNNNVIREGVTINGPTKFKTSIGNNCFIMAKSHIGHDAVLEDGVTLAPFAAIGGHTVVKEKATIGMHASIHQNLIVEELTMVGMGAMVVKNHPPFSMLMGIPAKRTGFNFEGIRRAGLDLNAIEKDYNAKP